MVRITCISVRVRVQEDGWFFYVSFLPPPFSSYEEAEKESIFLRSKDCDRLLGNWFGLEWWARPDSNRGSSPHPPACLPSEGDVLPTRLRAHFHAVWFGDSLRIWNKCFPFIKSFFNQCQSKRGVTCLNDVDNAGRLGDDDKFDHVLAFLFFLFFAVVGYAVFHFL